eukprot:jgi/Mesen1/7929/ME000422S07093
MDVRSFFSTTCVVLRTSTVASKKSSGSTSHLAGWRRSHTSGGVRHSTSAATSATTASEIPNVNACRNFTVHQSRSCQMSSIEKYSWPSRQLSSTCIAALSSANCASSASVKIARASSMKFIGAWFARTSATRRRRSACQISEVGESKGASKKITHCQVAGKEGRHGGPLLPAIDGETGPAVTSAIGNVRSAARDTGGIQDDGNMQAEGDAGWRQHEL